MVLPVLRLVKSTGRTLLSSKAAFRPSRLTRKKIMWARYCLAPTKELKKEAPKRTSRIASIKVGEGMLGRVVDTASQYWVKDQRAAHLRNALLSAKGPGVIYRQPVNEPLQTGIKAIDATDLMGVDSVSWWLVIVRLEKQPFYYTIINQKSFMLQANPYFTFTSLLVESLYRCQRGACVRKTARCHMLWSLPLTPIRSMQFYAPFAGAAIGEFSRDTGRPALIVFDDLSKQAVAYRESLLLRAVLGRIRRCILSPQPFAFEACSQDQCIRRYCKSMNDLPESLGPLVKGGGSLTALPIIETQAGDVSAYIPTNVISITDGQIFLGVEPV